MQALFGILRVLVTCRYVYVLPGAHEGRRLSATALTGKAVFVREGNGCRPRRPHVSQSFVVEYGEAEAYHAKSRGLHLTQQPIVLLFASTICQKQSQKNLISIKLRFMPPGVYPTSTTREFSERAFLT